MWYFFSSFISRTMTETDKTNPSMPDDDRVPSRPLRVCCYGSSSSRTPARYTDAAYRLGRALALRGHTCVNGAGSFGCMDAMNVGANDAGGRIVGIIHEKFVQEGGDWFEGTSSVFRPREDGGGGTHEIVIARGNDLQERKRLLVEGADALAVLPGGPGTWDEVRFISRRISSPFCAIFFCVGPPITAFLFPCFSYGKWHARGT